MDTSGWEYKEVAWTGAKAATTYHCPSAGCHVSAASDGVLLVPVHLEHLVARDLWGADSERNEVLTPAPDLQSVENNTP